MLRPIRTLVCSVLLLAISDPSRAADAPPDTAVVLQPEVIVSATRTKRDLINLPNAATVIGRDELRKRGTRTLAEALQDVVGLDTGEGSDNGSRIPNVGLWGLKEFDALLFSVNGVPVGGPFNPSLVQIPVTDIDRIEIVKGPQGTMYGVSAFAGMINVFTPDALNGGVVTVGGGSFGQGHGFLNWGRTLSGGRDLRVNGSFERSDGWQDRTESNVGRGDVSYGFGFGKGHMILGVSGMKDEQDWGSPLPYDSGELLPGFQIDRNYAVGGAEVGHEVFKGTSRLTWPVGSRNRIENTLDVTRDKQDYLRSFGGEISGDTLVSEGLELEPTETSLYEDVRLVASLEGKGTHELVTGAALTWGKTSGEGREFEFDQLLSQYPAIPDADQVPTVDDREFEDMRTFVGLYAHDAWTPTRRLTLEAGGRLDIVGEELETEADIGGVPTPVKDKQDNTDFSGDVSALIRLLPEGGSHGFQHANLYGSFRTGFKPAAPNLAEAEAAEILDPERTKSFEVGLKTRAAHGIAFDVSYFDMTFENMVVSILGSGGLPELTNAGEQRFRGVETDLHWTPEGLHGSSFAIGYANHSARFVDFTFVTPDGEFRDVSGNKLEMVPGDLVSGRASVQIGQGLGGFVAGRYQSERPFNRRNTFFADAYTEWDAGLSFDRGVWHASAVGRNLGDDRHVTTESEIGDAQFYVAPPRRFQLEVGYRF
jgi:outer membrane receptor protein involved in Fe transport